MSMGDRVIVMYKGTIRQIAPPDELYDRPRTAWVANFIGSPAMNLLDGHVRNGTIQFSDGNEVPVPVEGAEGEVSLGVRPENLSLATSGDPSGNALDGTVDTIEPLGEFVLVNVDVGETIVRVKEAETDVTRGDRVSITYDTDAAYVYDDDGLLVG